MGIELRLRVRWFSIGPWGHLALRGAQGPAQRNMRFRVDSNEL